MNEADLGFGSRELNLVCITWGSKGSKPGAGAGKKLIDGRRVAYEYGRLAGTMN